MASGSRSTESKIRYAMVIDLRRCIGCHSCSVACKSENDVPLGVWRTWVKEIEKGTYPHMTRSFLPLLCNNCDRPTCVTVCPTKASRRLDNGIVIVDPHLCIGCRYCMAACPYGMRYIHPLKGIVQKCHWCWHRLQDGTEPACVSVCPTEALVFGNLSDREDTVYQLIMTYPVQTMKPEMGTSPHVFYIGADRMAMDMTGVREER